MDFHQAIHFCPRCGGGDFPEESPSFFRCAGCDFHLHLNIATAVAGILTDDAGRMLLIRRGREPGKGKYSVPGGFVDAGETAEEALVRELREEVNLEVGSVEYLCSSPNRYLYRGVVFPVLDLVFVCGGCSLESLQFSDEVEGYELVRPEEIDPDSLAFPSIRHALNRYCERKR